MINANFFFFLSWTACNLNLFHTWASHMAHMRQIMSRQVGSYLKFSMCLHPSLTLKPVKLPVDINKAGSFVIIPLHQHFKHPSCCFVSFLHTVLLTLHL